MAPMFYLLNYQHDLSIYFIKCRVLAYGSMFADAAKHCGPSVDPHKQARKKIACHLFSHLARIIIQKNGTYALPPKLST